MNSEKLGGSLVVIQTNLTAGQKKCPQPKNLIFGRDETLQHSHKEFDNVIRIWYF